MPEVLIMGEMLVEIMRDKEDVALREVGGFFKGPYPSGAPAICIDAIARMGHSTAMVGGVGNDDFGRVLIDRLQRDGVDTSHVLVSDKTSTGCAFVTYFKDGHREFIFHMSNTPAVEAKAPDANDFTDVKIMHVMGCSLMASASFAVEILKTMDQLIAHGAKISFDPNVRRELFKDDSAKESLQKVMENTSFFLPGYEELLLFTGESTVEAAIKKCFTYPKMEVVALKNGSKGSTIFTKNTCENIGVYKVEQKDATGAGDCFDGAFICGILEGRSPVEAAKMGAAAGALNAAAFGPMEGRINRDTVWAMIEGR